MKSFHHALKFKYDVCIGCSHCTGVCPTGAIHIEGGHPVLNPDRCIDCGMCYKACPASAIYIEQDDFSTIYSFKYPVILLPSMFSAQFPGKINHRAIISALYYLGFKYIHEVEESAGIIKEYMINKMADDTVERPVISTFCPAVVRLIQVKYPSLLSNLLHVKPPVDLTALYIMEHLTKNGIKREDIGIFYVSPCAAKIAAIKSPAEGDESPVNGIINMNYLFNKVYRIIKQRECELLGEETDFKPLSKDSLSWSITGGEVNLIKEGRNLAIDEIHNVDEFLEKIENEEIKNVNFLELRACDESCLGGILCAANRFIAVERQKKRAEIEEQEGVADIADDIEEYKQFLVQRIETGEILPRSMDKLDNDISIAMKKMKRAMAVHDGLPKVDCRICGYKSCKMFSEAVASGEADLKQCVFVRIDFERSGDLSTEESLEIMKKVWGEKKMGISDGESVSL